MIENVYLSLFAASIGDRTDEWMHLSAASDISILKLWIVVPHIGSFFNSSLIVVLFSVSF